MDWGRAALWIVLSGPFAILAWDFWREIQAPGTVFGADPGEAVTRYLGEWAIRGLMLTLAVSPAARALKRPRLVRYRRLCGLFAFAYALAHFGAYFALLAGLSLMAVLEDFAERPYIAAGSAALLGLVPLAITSTRRWQRRLQRNWRRLHRAVYAIGALACLHLAWLSKGGYGEAALYTGILIVLLGERVVRIARSKRVVGAQRSVAERGSSGANAEEPREAAHRAHWRENLRLVGICLAIWFVVSFGCGVLLVDVLNQVQLGGFQLGFWFAQQGSIYVFVALIFFYAWRVAKIDRKHGVEED